ncbi:M126 protein, partial [Himantopus himantopus]|nr:M126 protein [Himantopus himantopus]
LNKDRDLTFEEFTIVLAKLTDDAHRISHNDNRSVGQWDAFGCTGPCGACGRQTQEPLSELEKAMDVIIDVFHQYSRREGDRDTLTKKELKLLIEKQLANYLRHVKNKATIDEIMKDLDINKDAQISFCEVMLLITRVTIATHEHLHDVEDHQQQQHKHQHQHHH